MLATVVNYFSMAQSIFGSDEFKIFFPAFTVLIIYVVMQWKDKLPSVNSLQEFAAVLNSRGGNILILTTASFYFFRHSVYLFYALMNMSVDGRIGQDNAFALMALQFVSSTAFGGAFGALLKTMTGENSKARMSDIPTTNGTKVTVSAVPVVTTTTSVPPETNVSSDTTTVTNPAPQP